MLLAVLLAAVLSSANDEVVARVDSATIGEANVAERVRGLKADGRKAGAGEVLTTLVEDALLYAEGERLGLERQPEVAREIESARRRLAAEELLRREIDDRVRADDATLRQFFHAGADSARLRIAVLASREKAQAALERLRAGGSFAEEAQGSLESRSARSGGDTGTVQRLAMRPAVAEAAFSAPLHTPVGPVEYEPGWAILEVVERHVGDEKEYQSRREGLGEYVVQQMRAQGRRHFAEMARKRAKVALDEDFLEKSGDRITASPGEADHVLARVGAGAVRYGEVIADLAWMSRGRQASHLSGAAVKKDLAWKRVDRLLVEEEALAKGYGKGPEVAARLEAERRALVATAAAQRIRGGVTPPGAAEVETYYRQHLADFHRPARRECSHIVAPTREAAEAVRRKLAGGDSFEASARHLSLDSSTSDRGGRMGEIGFDRLDALEKAGDPGLAAAMRDARPGETSPPVQSRMGWHVLRCGPVTPARAAPLDEVRAAVESRLASERAAKALDERLAALRAKARISVDEGALQRALAGAD